LAFVGTDRHTGIQVDRQVDILPGGREHQLPPLKLFGLPVSIVSSVKLGDAFIEWVKSFKYLGLFYGGHMINISFHVIKIKLYAACNSILAYSRRSLIMNLLNYSF